MCSFSAHAGSVTCMCDFAGLLYTGGCSETNDGQAGSHEHDVLTNNDSNADAIYLNNNINNTKLSNVYDD